jgi:SAM-dependent methyltransferase
VPTVLQGPRQQVKSLVRKAPPSLKRTAARAIWAPVDAFEAVTGRRPADVPPRGLRRYVGAGDYELAASNYSDHLVRIGGLQPHHRVLDVGCGIGRMAGPLTTYLTDGSYEGMDIVPEGIVWANRHLAPMHPRFRFNVCDVYNEYYHRAGKQSAAEFRFPYPDDEFDFVFATSLFTHLMPDAVANYLVEIGRVLKPGGRCLLTFLVIDDVSRAAITDGRGIGPFFPEPHDPPRWWTINLANPEHTIAFEERDVRSMFAAGGLDIVEPIVWGTWSGRPGCDGQDMIVATAAG